jgi:hypothetical protein
MLNNCLTSLIVVMLGSGTASVYPEHEKVSSWLTQSQWTPLSLVQQYAGRVLITGPITSEEFDNPAALRNLIRAFSPEIDRKIGTVCTVSVNYLVRIKFPASLTQKFKSPSLLIEATINIATARADCSGSDKTLWNRSDWHQPSYWTTVSQSPSRHNSPMPGTGEDLTSQPHRNPVR